MKTFHFLLAALLVTIFSCRQKAERADAYGNFEAREVLISAEAGGKLLEFSVKEGMKLKRGQRVGLIDTAALHLQRKQLLAGIAAIRRKTQDPQPEIEVLREQKNNLLREQRRVKALLADAAATPKQLDDIEGQLQVIEEQIAAAHARAQTANRGILAEIEPLRAQVEQVEEQLRKCYLINPVDGTVLLQLAEAFEITAPGRPLYKIADLQEMTLRAYVGGTQLPHLRIGQEVTILIDEDAEHNRAYPGRITWIADDAEFTPKMIQTKEERVNLVYAIKVVVENDGRLKIGMPAEVLFTPPAETAPGATKAATQ